MNNVLHKIKVFFNRRAVKQSIPFFALIIGGSIGLKQFTSIRYEYSNTKSISPEVAKNYGVDMKKRGEVTLESEFEKIQNLDIDNWNQVRGPRPWEEKLN